MPSTGPNPTGAVGIGQLVRGKPIVNLPGCPPSPYNFLSTVTHYLTFGKLPELDAEGRPKFAYSRLIHENCERRPHYDAGRFAAEFGDAGHRQGWCLYRLGCKGPETHANCPAILFNDIGGGSWPVGTGHPCIGCAEQGVGFAKPIHALAEVKSVTGPASYPRVVEEQGNGPTVGAAALAAGVVGMAVGAGVATARKLGKTAKRETPPTDKE
jgi:hydrogenase small subunit